MNLTDQISVSIEKLSGALTQSGKQGPAEFYKSLAGKIRSAKNALEVKRILLDNVKKSGALSQYADFSVEEEKLFDEIFNLSEKILQIDAA